MSDYISNDFLTRFVLDNLGTSEQTLREAVVKFACWHPNFDNSEFIRCLKTRTDITFKAATISTALQILTKRKVEGVRDYSDLSIVHHSFVSSKWHSGAEECTGKTWG